jgi:Zn finger protein HypA/HybF involved in hydrogenase expression
MKRLTIEEAERRCPDMVKGQVWRGVDENYKFLCKTHGEYKQIFYSHNYGYGCEKCGRDAVGKSNSLTIEDAEKRFPNMVKGQTWKGTKAKYQFLCNKGKGHKYEQSFDSRRVVAGCPVCSGYGRTIKIAETEQPDLVRGQTWRGVDADYKYRCKTHGEYQQSFAHHKRQGCPKCGRMIVEAATRLTIEEAEARCPDMVKGQKWRPLFGCLLELPIWAF